MTEKSKMKTTRKILVGAILAGAAISAHAIPTFDASYTGPSFALTSAPETITLDLTLDGFDPGTDTLSSAFVVFGITGSGGGQSFTILADGNPFFSSSLNSLNTANTTGGLALTGDVLSALEFDGKMVFSFSKSGGNTFTLTSAMLSATARESVTAVPEPGTLALLGLGLLGLGAMRRRMS